MKFDPTISLGSVVMAGTFVLTLGGMWLRQASVMAALTAELKALRELVERINEQGTSYGHKLAERVSRIEGKAQRPETYYSD